MGIFVFSFIFKKGESFFFQRKCILRLGIVVILPMYEIYVVISTK